MADPQVDWAKVEIANKRREREDAFGRGTFSLLIGVSCWVAGGFCMIAEGMFGSNEFPSMSAIFGILAFGGCAVGVQSIRGPGRRFLASMGLSLNFLFLLAAFVRVMAWVISWVGR